MSDYQSKYQIDIQDEFGAAGLPTERMIAAIRYVLGKHKTSHDIADNAALTVVISHDKRVQDLNKHFRDVDAPTDVLSFPADPLPEDIDLTEDEGAYLGDLIIAYPYTMHEAAEAGHALDDELVLLVIHGTLHLLGYDHDNEANQDRMWAAQADALAAAKVAIDVPRFTFGDPADPGDSHADSHAD